jgi:hypothetical protein
VAVARLAAIAAERHCATCTHYRGESCFHPQARDNWGYQVNMRRYLPADVPVWPPKAPTDSCGWWAPTETSTAVRGHPRALPQQPAISDSQAAAAAPCVEAA